MDAGSSFSRKLSGLLFVVACCTSLPRARTSGSCRRTCRSPPRARLPERRGRDPGRAGVASEKDPPRRRYRPRPVADRGVAGRRADADRCPGLLRTPEVVGAAVGPPAAAGRAHRLGLAYFPTAPGGAEELRRFARIEERLWPLYRRIVSEPRAPQTVVVVPSLSLDAEELAKISGVHHYEERLLCMLMLLRMPRTRLVFVTSQQVPTAIVDYYLHLLPGVPLRHARGRLTLLSCHDSSDVPLTQKILDRPRLIERIKGAIADPESAHLSCFNSTALERSLAVRLGIPLYGNDPELNGLGTKSGSREVFREAGVPLPDGFEHLRDQEDIAEAVVELKRRHPDLRRVAIKLDEGFSGEGNAIFNYDGAPEGRDLKRWVRD